MTKKLMMVLCGMMLMLTMCFVAGKEVKAEVTEDGNFEYYGRIESNDTPTAKISAYIGSEKDVVIPTEINGYTVNEIGEFAFQDCDDLVTVSIPDTVTKIGKYAFDRCKKLAKVELPSDLSEIEEGLFNGCENLTDINIPDTLKEIGMSAFDSCGKLDNINIPDTVEEIGNAAFFGCSNLTEINIPANLTSINGHVFTGCSNLKEINIPDKIESISWGAFSGCISLKHVNIPASVQSIYEEENPFSGCIALESIDVDPQNDNYYSKEGVLFNKTTNYLLLYPASKINTSYTVPEGIKGIRNNAFANCSILKEIKIPENLETIETQAFYKCSNLTNVNIPESITKIEDRLFTLCSSLKEVKLPETVTYLGMCAFDGCTSLEKVNIPENITTIQWGTFVGCESLEKIVLPRRLEKIEAVAFEGCKSLSEITIPKNVQEIESNPFRECDSLVEFKVEKGNIRYATQGGVLFDKVDKVLVSYPSKKSGSIYTIPIGIQKIGVGAFGYVNGELETVELPETVNDIGTNAFYITSVNGSTSINTVKVFNPECQISAEDVHRVEYTIDVDITLFGYPESTIYTFAQEYGNEFKVLTENDTLTFPVAFSPEEGVVLEESPVEEPPLEEPPLEEPPTEDFSPQQPSGNDTAIGANNNIVTGNTEQPSSLPAVGAVLNDAGSKARYTVTVAGATLTYKAPTNKKVKKVTIPATVTIDGITYKVTDIAPNAFKGCKKLKKITIGTGITTIGKKAFAGCKNIKNIIVKSKSLKKIGKNAFKGINKAAKIKVPKNKLKAYKKLFKKAKLAKSIKVTK